MSQNKSTKRLAEVLKDGASLRYRGGFGFYAVKQGQQINVNQSDAESALRAGDLRCESAGPDKFGVYHFSLKSKPCHS